MKKAEAIEFAQQYGWTKEDAKRAYNELDLQEATEQQILIALVSFSGPELAQRQRLQAAQKGEATKQRNKNKEIEEKYLRHLEESQNKIKELRSTFLPVINRVYKFAKGFGMRDPWIEILLETYDEFWQEQKPKPDEQEGA